MDFNKVRLDYEDSVAVLTLNHPEVLNAVGPEMKEGLGDAVSALHSRPDNVRCLMIAGAGRGFCSGANLVARGEGPSGTLRNFYHPFFFELRDLEMPIVTAVNGAAAGVGMSLALIGDIVCASKGAFFLQAFARIGLVPDGGATFMLPRLVGWGRAMELSLLAERLPAERALEWGLVNRVYDDRGSAHGGRDGHGPPTRQRAAVVGPDPQGLLGDVGQLVRTTARPRGASAGGGRREHGLAGGGQGVSREAGGAVHRYVSRPGFSGLPQSAR